MTLTFKLDLIRVTLNEPAKYLGQSSLFCFISFFFWQHRQTHRPTELIVLPGSLKWLIVI